MTLEPKWDREFTVAMSHVKNGVTAAEAARRAGMPDHALYQRAEYRRWRRTEKAAKRKTVANGGTLTNAVKPPEATMTVFDGNGDVIAALRAEVALLHRVIDKLTR